MRGLLDNLNMTKKLLATPVAVVVSMAGLVGMAYVGFSSQSAAIDDLYNNRFVGYQSCTRIINDVDLVQRNLYKVLGLAGSNADAAIIGRLAKEQLATLDQTQAFA